MTTLLLNNRYQIIQLLGAGGFGQTYLAEDIHMPSRRRCVIKQLKPITNDPQMYELIQQRFGREAAALESLGEGSDQIPNLYAYFSENGQFYLVQEWIQGQTLSDRVETRGALSENTVYEILTSLLRVLDYVHQQGIIYRDIKPDNIILRQPNNQPVLIDFGAVKETMATVLNSQGKLTQTMVVGTPGFMSPEQATGRPVYASDIYSLGLTAIYMLTGKLPQDLETDAQNEEILWQQYAPKISPKLATAINKAIEYHPRDRYTTAIKMLEGLQSNPTAPTNQPSQATHLMYRGSRTSKKHNFVPSSQTPTIIAPPQRNWQRFLTIGGLFAMGAIALALVANFPKLQQSPVVSSPSRVTSEPPIESPPIPTITPATPEATIAASPSPVVETPPPTRLATPEAPPIPPTPEAIAPSPEVETTPPTPAPPQPEPAAVPGFPTGTSENQVKATLGSPTKTARGVWGNTRAAIYDLQPNQVTLGYLFDRNSGRLRQTEVSFAQSIDTQVMQTTLQEMLGGNTSAEIVQGLEQVHQRRTNRYSFNASGLKGVIERNNSDRIYIGVWDADLH